MAEIAEASLNELYRAIGGLTAEVKALRDQLVESERRSAEHRNRVYGRLEDIDDRAAKLERRVDQAVATLAEIKPTVDDVLIWKQRGIGALAAVGIAASAIGAAIGLLWTKIAAWLGIS